MNKLTTMQDPAVLAQALDTALSALNLISMPARPDGTYNRSREACEELARKTLEKIGAQLDEASLSKAQQNAASPATARLPAALTQAKPGSKFVVYSDGGSRGNPGPSAWGVVVCDAESNPLLEDSGFIGRGITNQVAELQAATEGLARTPEGASVELVSDSQYVVKGLGEWRRNWERNGFMNASNKPVANKAYWLALYALADKRAVKTRWVRGHSGHPLNERCDHLVNQVLNAHSR